MEVTSMARSRKVTALLNATAESLREERLFAARLAEEQLNYAARRGRAGSNFQLRLLKQSLRAAGVDYAIIERRQAQDMAGLQKFAAKQERTMIAQSRVVARRQDGMIKELLQRRIEEPAAEKPSVIRLESATDIIGEVISTQVPAEAVDSVTGTPGQNLAKGIILADAGDNARQVFVLLHFQFIWISDRDGVLNAIALVYPNFGYISFLHSACTGILTAGAVVDATMYISQLNASGQVIGDKTSTETFLNTKLEGADSLGKFNAFTFADSAPLIYNQQ